MKAGVACLMKLMKDLKDNEPSVALAVTSDEEIGGFNGTGYLSEIYSPEFAISAEPNTSNDGYMDIVVKQKGVLLVKISVTGESCHASRPWNGENAAEKLMEKYQEIKNLFPETRPETWRTSHNLGVMEAGEATNQVPREAEMKIDSRYTEGYPAEEVIRDLEEIEGIDLEVLIKDPMLSTEEDEEHVQELKEAVEEVTGGKSRVKKKEAASDMRHFSSQGVPAVVFGPEGYNLHGTGEYAVIESLGDYYSSLENFIGKIEEKKC